MKKIFTGFIFCLLLFGCKKEKFDYRNKFIGDYNFSIHTTAWGSQTMDTTYSYNGSIKSSTTDDKINIYFLENYSLEPIIYEDGSLVLNMTYSYHFKGEFESTTKAKFFYSGGGLGGGGSYDVIGIKQTIK